MDGFAKLPPECWRNIFKYFSRNTWTLMLHAIKCTTKTNRQLFENDKYLLEIISTHPYSAPLKGKYIHAKIKRILMCTSIDALQSFLDSIARREGTNIAMRLINQHLFYALKHTSSSFFRTLLTNIEINGKKPSFTASSLVKAIEYSYNKAEDIQTILMLLPILVSKFRHVDPDHVNQLEASLKNKQKLNTDNDIFDRIKRAIKKGNSSTELLLELSRPSEKKIIVPKGKLIRIEQQKFYSTHRISSVIKILDPGDRSKCVLQYKDHKAKHHEITVPRDPITNLYLNDGYRTDNIYDMIVSTKIGQEIFSSFPQQLVAVTEEALDLPWDQQPWFYCDLNDAEISQLIDYAAGSTLFITVSRGSQVYLYWSGDKHCQFNRYWQFPSPIASNYGQTLRTKLYSRLSQQAFIAGIYNKGTVKNRHIYQFYCSVAQGDLDNIKKLHKEYNIDLSQLTQPNILADYLTAVNTADEKVVDWLMENGCTGVETNKGNIHRMFVAHNSLLGLALQKCKLSVANTLLERHATSGRDVLLALISHHVISFETFMKYWNWTDTKFIHNTLLLKGLFTQVHKYKAPSNTNKILVTCAWQFGNDDNYFKLLPKEIMNEIVSYGLDEPEWYKIADCIVERGRTGNHFFSLNPGNFTLFAPYVVARYRKFDATFFSTLMKNLCYSQDYNNEKLTAYWISKISQLNPSIVPLSMDYFPNMLYYCLENEKGLPILKALMDGGFITKEFIRKPCPKETYNADHRRSHPPAWAAVLARNKAAVKYLCSKDAVPMAFNNLTLKQYLTNQCVKEDMFQFVLESFNK